MVTKEQKECFLASYTKGLSLRAIAKKECFAPNTIKKYLLELGCKINIQNRIYKLKTEDLFLQGLYCGLWTGDGTQYYDKGYRIKICLHSGNKELIIFVQDVLWCLFGKKTLFVDDHGVSSGFVRFKSKFIFEFVKKYLLYGTYKTKTIQLKYGLYHYSKEFIEGFLLGLMLSDGCMKKRFSYNTISRMLALNVKDILVQFGFLPKIHVHNREKYGWNDLFMVQLTKIETKRMEKNLDEYLHRMNYTKGFSYLKG